VIPEDASAAQLERQATHWRALGPARQAQVAAQQWVSGRRAAELALRSRYPAASDALILWLCRSQFVGEAVATRLYGPRPAQ
jgi:hypothetical protein